MNRRRAIWSIALLGGCSMASIGVFKWLDWHKQPNVSYLMSKKKILEALCETIIPATDTPGATEAGVADFILKMFVEDMDIVSQNRFIDGLKEMESYAVDAYGKSYMICTEEQKNEVMKYFEEKSKPLGGIAGKVQRKVLGDAFFSILKKYTCIGYCTSMVGATQVLAYTLVPGRFVGCIPMASNQKSWATK